LNFFKKWVKLNKIDQYYNDQEFDMDMGSKKGVAITVAILVAITIASFSVWIVNNSTNTEMTIVVTDFQNHQEGISERHKIISNAIETSFSKLINEQISTDEYLRIAEVSSSQNNALLMELAYSDAPEEWQESYINQIASLKSFEAYIIETMVMTNLINSDGELEQRTEILNNIEKLKEESIQYAKMANSSKPWGSTKNTIFISWKSLKGNFVIISHNVRE